MSRLTRLHDASALLGQVSDLLGEQAEGVIPLINHELLAMARELKLRGSDSWGDIHRLLYYTHAKIDREIKATEEAYRNVRV